MQHIQCSQFLYVYKITIQDKCIRTYRRGVVGKGIGDLFSFISWLLLGVATSCISLSLDILLIVSILTRLKLIMGLVIVCPLTIGFTTPLAGDFVDNILDESFPETYSNVKTRYYK